MERDLSVFFFPPRFHWVSLVKSFEFPFWNSHNYSGIPLLATLQPGVLYPPQLLYFILPFPVAWNWTIVGHFFFAGISLYVFLRYLQVSREGSLVGGVVFMLSGYLLSIHSLLSHLLAVPWVPLVVMFFLRYCSSGDMKQGVFCALLLSMEILAGAPEIALVNIFALVCLSCSGTSFMEYGLAGFAGHLRMAGKRLLKLSIILLLFLLIAAIQLVPFLELKMQSIRANGLSFQEAVTWSFAWRDFALFFLPDLFGNRQTLEKYWSSQSWLKTVYLGIVPFAFSIFYFVSKDRKRAIFGLFILCSLLLALGGNTPLYRFLHSVPPFNSIRYPVKFLSLFFFAISVSAALGFDCVRKGVQEKDSACSVIVKCFFYLGFFCALLWGAVNVFESETVQFLEGLGVVPPQFNILEYNLHNFKRLLLMCFIFGVLILLYLRVRRKPIGNALLISILTIDLFLGNYGFYMVAPWRSYSDASGLVTALPSPAQTERFFVTPKTKEFLEHLPMGQELIEPAYASLFGTFSVDGAEVIRIRHHEAFIKLLQRASSLEAARALIDMAGIRYLITTYPIDDPAFELLSSGVVNGQRIYASDYSAHGVRFALFSDVIFVKSDAEMVEAVARETFDPRRQLVLLSHEKMDSRIATHMESVVSLVSYSANEVVLACFAGQNSFLYISDTWYPGWRAYVDGKETKIYRANVAFRAVEVPAGKHTVIFRYVPMSFYLGLCLTTIGLLLCCFFVWRERRRRRSG